ncbi:MAG TPA: C1 family peptidase, partial [Thermodesulfobacteriota bacterium]|nr:C1 family peptidase [Thermodesulfobacteriota bacterium]
MKRKTILHAGLFILMFCLVAPFALAGELDEIRDAIRVRGARWHAAENPMTLLPFQERQKRLGMQHPFLTGTEVVEPPSAPPLVGAPAELDWRNNGGSYVTGIRDQGSCGGCWSFATTATLESVTLMANRTPNTDLDLSEQVLISCSGAGNCESGGSVDRASNFIQSTGLP